MQVQVINGHRWFWIRARDVEIDGYGCYSSTLRGWRRVIRAQITYALLILSRSALAKIKISPRRNVDLRGCRAKIKISPTRRNVDLVNLALVPYSLTP